MPRAARKSHTPALAFDAITVEGALIAPAMLARIAEQKAGGQANSDYNIPKGLTLRDEIARHFRIGQALFVELFASARPSAAATTRFVEALLRYILDPADVKGPDYPSETFRVLKNNEKARYGEYRTARLVLAAWDAQEARSAAAQ